MRKLLFMFAFALLSSPVVKTQTIGGWFPFTIAALDTFNVEFSPKFPFDPIEDMDFVSIDPDGHFVINGQRVRFWGTPSYPFKEEYQLPREEIRTLAREFRKMGVNIIRLHLMDSRSFNGVNTVFGDNSSTRGLNQNQLDKLDYYIAEFKKQGIYVMCDLLCDRKYTAEDGVQNPDSINNASKEVNFFDPALIQLQKEYARELLSHVNPYTGKALKDDPVLALIDIVNEGWFLHSIRCDEIKPVSEGGFVSDFHYDMLTGLWNDFLIEKYGTEQALMTRWGIWPVSEVAIGNPGFESGFDGWDCNAYGSVNTTMEISSNEAHSGSKSFHINTRSNGGLIWECYANNSCQAEGGQIYTVSFWAKSENENTIRIDIAQSDWVAGSDFTISGNLWTNHKFSFKAADTGINNTRILIQMGNVLGNLWLDDVSVTKGETVLHDGGSLSEHTIPLMRIIQNDSEIIKQRKLDQSEFFIKIQTDYFTEMYNFLKGEIGVRIPVTGSNYLVGIPDIFVQSHTDFVDSHGYWSYNDYSPATMIGSPHFNNPMINLFAGLRVKGKALTASEYNFELYNPQANQALFFLSAYGSFHEADMLMVHGYDYGPLQEGVLRNSLDNYHRVYDKAMLPGFAYVYRNGLIAPAKQTIDINFTRENVNNLIFRDDEMWGTDAYPNDYPFELIYQHAVRSNFDTDIPYQANDYPVRKSSPFTSDTGEIEWDSTGIFSINTQQFCAFVGELHRFTGKRMGPVQIAGADKSSGVTLLSLDEKSLDESKKMLLTVTTQQKNDEGYFNGYRDLTGHAPIMLEATEISINLTNEADVLRVNWLDPHGNPSGYYEVFTKNSSGVIPVRINTYDHNGVWFGVEAVEPVPQIELVEFNSGQYPVMNEETNIHWYSAGVDNVDVYWSEDHGITLHEIQKSIPSGTHSLVWKVAPIQSDSCSIISRSSTNSSLADTITFPVIKLSDNNLIKNGTFGAGMSFWDFYPDLSSAVNYSVDNERFNLHVTVQPEAEWHYNLSQPDIKLQPGHYVFDLDFSLTDTNFTYVYFTFSDQSNWKIIAKNEFFIYRWQNSKHVRYEFDYHGSNDEPLLFSLNLGGVQGNAFIDNITLRKVEYGGAGSDVPVIFRVDMQKETVTSSGVYLNGSFCNWNPSSAIKLTGNGTVYSATLRLPVGDLVQYKFINGAPDNWAKYEIIAGKPCAYGPDANRGFVVPEDAITLDLVCFERCEPCNASSLEEFELSRILVTPNPSAGIVRLSGLPNHNVRIRLFSGDGRLISEKPSNGSDTVPFDLSNLNSGFYYFILAGSKRLNQSFKIIKL